MKLGVSVIICCFNSSERLPETIRHLAEQEVPYGVQWEILLVDNASTDGTAEIGLSEWNKYERSGISFKVLHQPVPGRHYAYQLGASEATYEYLLGCDDDNRLSKQYITKVFERMKADEKIGVLGGCGVLVAEEPAWHEIKEHEASYVNGPQTWADTAHWVYGAGSACRKSVLLHFYDQNWKQVAIGRAGTKLISGEDVEICFMFYLNGYKISADDTLKFDHFVPLKRQNLDYLLDLQYWISYSDVLLNSYLMLIEDDKRPVYKKLVRWFNFNLTGLVRLSVMLAKRKLFKRRPASPAEQLKLRAYLGTLHSIVANRKMLNAHYVGLTSLLSKLQRTSP